MEKLDEHGSWIPFMKLLREEARRYSMGRTYTSLLLGLCSVSFKVRWLTYGGGIYSGSHVSMMPHLLATDATVIWHNGITGNPARASQNSHIF